MSESSHVLMPSFNLTVDRIRSCAHCGATPRRSWSRPATRDEASQFHLTPMGGNPRDRVAAFCVLQLLPGIGPATARQIHAAVETQPDLAAALETAQPPGQAQAECRPPPRRTPAYATQRGRGWIGQGWLRLI